MDTTVHDKAKIIPSHQFQKSAFPSLSVIVPSFNQAAYLEETLRSIIGQGYPELELIVIDGGSTDGSIDIIRRYQDHLAYWVSEPDRGQSHAINKGLEKASGEWVAWMNSDDCYLPGALQYVFSSLPHQRLDFIYGTCTTGATIETRIHKDFRKDQKSNLFQLLLFFHSTEHIIPSQSVFIRREIIEQAGMLNEDHHLVMDLEWFARIFLTTKRRFYYRYPACFYRKHQATKTRNNAQKMHDQAKEVALQYRFYLNVWQRYVLNSIINSQKEFRRHYSLANSLRKLLVLFLRFPFSCWYTRHFFPMVFRSVFPRK